MNAIPGSESKAKAPRPVFHWDDALLLEEQLNEEERMIRDAARAFCQDRLMPRVQEYLPACRFRPDRRNGEHILQLITKAVCAA